MQLNISLFPHINPVYNHVNSLPQGGVDSDETTAAYMLIALTEGNMYGLNSKDEVNQCYVSKCFL